ncbi:RES domain-containing protein [Fulvivirga sp. M361]|uniref:RES family NAD+ phosphorylase n=1 Tax=Fulvivirga sp. M361 TaxID=2594266 RepID=UPI00117B987D|nr:RES family NAD+ phosphorylase [Fulvivirga sp. M361]TRX60879.1 RES domain-containing protein [Fulvivirga sp. M361]
MTLYHIDKWKYRNIWPPEGTLHASGRWNEVGQWMIYCSPSIALAKLEILANESFLPIKRVCMTIEVKEQKSLYKVSKDQLSDDWLLKPYPKDLTTYSKKFLTSGCLIMQVPSAQSQREYNYLINVRHTDFNNQITLKSVISEPFDPRLK